MDRRMALLVGSLIFAVTCAPLPLAAADDTDTQFIGEVSFFLKGTYLDPPTVKALIADANKVCAMSDAGFSEEAREFINSKWNPSDSFGFMAAATGAYCPEHLNEWQGL